MIITKDLHELPKTTTRFIDTRFDLQNTTWGGDAYQQDHIQGAVYWHLEDHLSDMASDRGRHPAPSKDHMSQLIQKSGLSYEDEIIVYDQGNAPFASRAVVLLLWAGFTKVSLAREGYNRLKEVYPVEGGTAWYPATDQQLHFNDSLLVDQEDVKTHIAHSGVLIDARSFERYRGIVEPIDKVAGHIPTAQNFDWEQLKTEKGLMTSKEAESLLLNFPKDETIVTYCGSGVTASPLTIALLENGRHQTKLYTGSYSDWIQTNEIETSK